METLKLDCVSYTYPKGENPVFDHACFSVSSGEAVIVKGESGAGKTTLLYLLSGILTPQKGSVYFKGQIIKASGNYSSSFRRKNIGFVLQKYVLINDMNVMENVLLPLGRKSRERISKAKEVLTRVGMNGYEERYPSELSSGQQQRVAIARAIVNDPCIILADEPTAALDSQNSRMIFELLKSLSQNAAVVIATHDPLADEFGFMEYQISGAKIRTD